MYQSHAFTRRAPDRKLADTYELLRALLIVRGPDDSGVHDEAIARLLSSWESENGTAWENVAAEADYHGVAPLVAPLITAFAARSSCVPTQARRLFMAVASRYRHLTLAREACIDNLLVTFQAEGIRVLLLKGAALAHFLYPRPDLRQMVDFDILIDPADTDRAVRTVRGLGYEFAPGYQSRFAGRLHHLPVATTTHGGYSISLEVHHNAFSPDQAGSLGFADLTSSPQRVQRSSGIDGLTLGHTDMLRHLTRHAFEPARRVRLMHLYDLWRYQTLYRNHIDWQELGARFPDVVIALRLVNYVFLDAGSAAHPLGAEIAAVPSAVGYGMVPLSETMEADLSLSDKLRAVFNPPAWWLHGFYGIPPEKSLLRCRTVQHPATVARWLTRRAAAYIGSLNLVPELLPVRKSLRVHG